LGAGEREFGRRQTVLPVSSDAAASRAYYAAFHAVAALFALEGRSFTRHSAVEAAVHRDLVRTGRWPAELGKLYTRLVALRQTGDYGGGTHVAADEAADAITVAERILANVDENTLKNGLA
jgi:uncharacterized protein (UPF0332 family)